MRAEGTNPTPIAASPEDGVELDLDARGTDGQFTFAVRDTGSSSPLFGLQVVECTQVTDPVLIDPVAVGLLYVGPAALQVDPYSGFVKNLVTTRLEFDALFHVRDARGAYVLTAS